MTTAVLGVDVGTSAVKAMLVDETGTVRSLRQQPYPTHRPAPGIAEQSPRDWLVAATTAIRASLETTEGWEVAAIAVSGHMSAPVLVDEANAALAPCHTIADTRADIDLPGEIRDEIAARTGNLPAAYFSLPKLLWWRRHHPELLARTTCVLTPKDFVTAWLSGEAASDPTDAGNMLLLDPLQRVWMPDLARAAGLDPRLLPRLAEPGTVLGSLHPGPAAALGLPDRLPVATGAADMAAALLGMAIGSDEIAVTIGTSATIIAGVSAPDPALLGRLTCHPGVVAGALYALGSHFNGGACLDWLAGILGGAEPLRAAAEAAASIASGSDGLLFVPYLLGSGSPDFDPARRGAFLGLGAAHRPAHLLRAVVEGVTADLCLSIDLLDPPASRSLVLAGGGANLSIWPQVLADLAGRPVALTPFHDASALGAALLAGVSIGWFGGTMEAASRRVRRPAAMFVPSSPGRAAEQRRRFDQARSNAQVP